MSYEAEMLESMEMPSRAEVEKLLLISLFKNEGSIKEFGSEEKIVSDLANQFSLTNEQRNATLKTIYRKENRLKISLLWHRLLYRAAANLAKSNFITHPTKTLKLSGKREWMLTAKGFDLAANLLNISQEVAENSTTKFYELEKVVKNIQTKKRPQVYNPIEAKKSERTTTRNVSLRARGFRMAVIEAYGYKCAVCGLKLKAPDTFTWEVEAAHIVPKRVRGKDDIWNGIALCHLHHWAFDVGWFSLQNDYKILLPKKVLSDLNILNNSESYEFFKTMENRRIILPTNSEICPHEFSLKWHRDYILNK